MASGYALFDFVLNYNFAKEVSFDEKITIYCQLISQYENIINIVLLPQIMLEYWKSLPIHICR